MHLNKTQIKEIQPLIVAVDLKDLVITSTRRENYHLTAIKT